MGVKCLVLLMVFRSDVEPRLTATTAGREPTLQPIPWKSTLDPRTLDREHGAMLAGGLR